MSNRYCFNGLLWFDFRDRVKISDAKTGEVLVNSYRLWDPAETIEIPGDYNTHSPYYMEDIGDIVTDLNGRVFTKVNAGPSYGYGYWDGSSCNPVLLSMDQNAVTLSWHYVTQEFEYDGKTWYTGGNGYGFDYDYATVNRFDISSYAPFSTDSTDTYKLPNVQKAYAALNIIYNKNHPIPGKYLEFNPYYMDTTGAFAHLGYYDRTFNKLNSGPAYAFCCYDGTDTHAFLVSMTENNVAWSVGSYTPPSPEKFSMAYGYTTWYVSGFGYSEQGNYSTSSDHYIDMSAGAPYASHAALAAACMDTIYW